MDANEGEKLDPEQHPVPADEISIVESHNSAGSEALLGQQQQSGKIMLSCAGRYLIGSSIVVLLVVAVGSTGRLFGSD